MNDANLTHRTRLRKVIIMFDRTTKPHPYELRAQPTKALLQRLYRDISTLAVEEVALGRIELAQRSTLAIGVVRSVAISTACGVLALACLGACAIGALALVVGLWGAALIVATVFLLAAAAFGVSARYAFARAVAPLPGTQQLREHADWSRHKVEVTIAALEHKRDVVTPIRDTALGLSSLGVALGAMAAEGSDKQG
jgi:hypothetical protein